jgi:hypothetical protein
MIDISRLELLWEQDVGGMLQCPSPEINVPSILHTGGVASPIYGQETMGASNTALLGQRRTIAAT